VELEQARRLWSPEPGWLNTATYGLPPRPAWEALQAALADWRVGRTSWEGWDESTGRARRAFADLVGVPPSRVATGATVSALVGLVAGALPDGARVLVPEEEFTSNLFPWLVHTDRGFVVRTVPARDLPSAVDRRTDVVAFSLVQSATGEVADVDAVLGAAAHAGALTVMDATQGVGWLPVDASAIDVIVCAGYKWLCSPRGTAFLAIRPEVAEQIRPARAGWYAGQDVHASFYGPPLRLAADARRFDESPAWFSWVGAAPALELIAAVGVDTIRRYDVGLADRFRAGLGLPPGGSAIVSVERPGAEERLAAAGVRAAVRGGRLRASFHLYTTEADVDRAIEALVG
jgi:selenocysteine lyase/cysteine desulfurase